MGRKSCTWRSFAVVFLLFLLAPADATATAPPTINGCQLFPADNIWNTPVDNLPVSPSSSDYINSIGANTSLHADFGSGTWEGFPIGIPFNVVPGNQPKVDITFDYSDESDPGPYPIPENPLIEGGSQSTGDRHILVLDKDACKLYEVWSAYPNQDGTWQAGSGAVFDLRSNRFRPDGWTSADAAGLPILAGLVRYDEVAAGEIRHALRFTVARTRNKYVWPARHMASSQTSLLYPPMGQRFRLKASFDISGYSSQMKVILKAMKKYGIILADNGSNWYISGTQDERWDNDLISSGFSSVKGSDFEAVDGTAPRFGKDFGRTLAVLNPNQPDFPAKTVFIHHSTGQNWLADDNGTLGLALSEAKYFVSDTNYGWGPDSIGSYTDIGNWWDWFRGARFVTYLSSLYVENGQNSSYSRLPATLPGENEIIMFKSCFPNSALQGSPDDPVPDIGVNPLKSQGSGSSYHTVANAKGIYIDLLSYFKTRRDKLFVVISAPPLTDDTYADNARAFNEWLVNEWLADYPYRNVAVFDFYNVLTTNGGNANTNDLLSSTGNHHRWWQGSIQHKTDGDNDSSPNVLEYPSGDDHPTQAGNLKATGEFVAMLNIFYHNFIFNKEAPKGDFDGDSKTDITVWRPVSGLWFTINSATATQSILQYGTSGDIPVPGDYDGDGKSDMAVWRGGVWFIRNSATGTEKIVNFGVSGDIPVPGNYDGIGKAEIAVYRPSAGSWFISNAADNTQRVVPYGSNGDNPVPGDYDGDGKTDIALFRPSNGTWFIRNSETGMQSVLNYGTNGDIPVPGDYDGIGKTEIAVFRPATGVWFIKNTADNTHRVVNFGTSGDNPVPADYDGDSKTDVAVFRPSIGTWFILQSSTGETRTITWGTSGDILIGKMPL